MKSNEDIFNQITEIRDFVNEPRKHYGLFQDRSMFFQLSSSMDVIEDTELAIQAFSDKVFEEDNRKGELYLAIYGLLQAIYVQQDAIMSLSESLGIAEKINSYERLIEIRNVRNDAVGHPTKRGFGKKGNKKKVSYNFITQLSLTKHGFDLLSFSNEGEYKSEYINTTELIADQHKYIMEILKRMKNKLQNEENDHKAKFRDEKLREIFHSSPGYLISKIYEGILTNDTRVREGYGALALGGLETVFTYLSDFREAVKRRDMSRYEALQNEYDEIEFASQWLHSFLERKIAGETIERGDKLTASIFIYFFEKKIKSLIQYAEEIDDEYAKDS